MISHLFARPARKVATAAVAALTAGVGLAGVVGALTVHPPAASRAAVGTTVPTATRSAANPYFVCVAYAGAWGICIGPPTN